MNMQGGAVIQEITQSSGARLKIERVDGIVDPALDRHITITVRLICGAVWCVVAICPHVMHARAPQSRLFWQ